MPRSRDQTCETLDPARNDSRRCRTRDAIREINRGADGQQHGERRGSGVRAADRGPNRSNLCDLVPGFLTRKREDSRAILAAAEHREAETLARLGHKMKGEGGSYGLDTITDIGRELEQAGKARISTRRGAWDAN